MSDLKAYDRGLKISLALAEGRIEELDAKLHEWLEATE